VNTHHKTSTHSSSVLSANTARVLVAEDSEIGQLLAITTLNKLGFTTIDTAYDGQEAVALYQRGHYDLVLVDCQMPILDGYQTAQRIRQIDTSTTRRIPIIAVTAHDDAVLHEKTHRAGMDGHIVKPLLSHVLQPVLQQWFITSSVPPIAVLKDDEALNFHQLRMFTNGDAVREHKVVTLFFQQVDDSIHQLHASIDAGDLETWCFVAHRLKGAAMNVGATTIRNISTAAELNPTMSIENKRKIVEQFNTAIAAVRTAFGLSTTITS
jgi:CheY-like chemotaxis protein